MHVGGEERLILNPNSITPIYMQIAEWLETEIINGTIQYDEKVYSQYQLAEMFNINPATAGKGISKLADENVLYKKRGLGMFVALDAKQIILNKRKNTKLNLMVEELVKEAIQLNVTERELLDMLKPVFSKLKGEAK
jgi:DNA-binding transcriptional regulator YhcF (GntR family)